MEVHAHTHPSASSGHRKKWHHYFWEFLMLFLAVFCGFWAENQREKIAEHHREKQFMISLAEDLENDTAELRRAIRQTDSAATYSDSLLFFLNANEPDRQISARLAKLYTIAGQRLSLINTDRTSSQLKNSGAMRLIRSKKVATGILLYWKQIDETNITLERYLIYRNAGRELSFKLFIIPLVYVTELHIPLDSVRTLKVIDNDSKKWDELRNLNAICGSIARVGHLTNLNKQLNKAIDLIELIKKEYSLK